MTSTIEVFPILNDNKTKDFYNDIFIKKIKSLEKSFVLLSFNIDRTSVG